RFCLVGDAAGLARDLSGEGIGPAIRSGRLAAEAVLALLRRGVPLAAYERAIGRLYGAGEPGWLGRRLPSVPDPVAKAAARFVLGSPAIPRRAALDRLSRTKAAASRAPRPTTPPSASRRSDSASAVGSSTSTCATCRPTPATTRSPRSG